MAYKRRLKFDKRLRFKKKMDIMYLLVFVLLSSIGTGYAYIRSNLNINGTANVTAASWDVHFENLNVTTGSVTATTPADITDDTTVEFAATLEEPNDFYEFTVDVVNEGTMDAMIDSFSISPELTTAQAKYLEYTVSYSDGTPLANKQELKANTTETLKVRFSYIENSDKTNYPTEDQEFTIEFSVDYTQADDTSVSIDHIAIVYTVAQSTYIGQAIPNNVTQYGSAAEVMADNSNYPMYFKHLTRNEIVVESYLEFVVSSALANANAGMTTGTYSLRGLNTYDENASSTNYCKAEYYNSLTGNCLSPYYESNKAILENAYDSSYCTENSSGYTCSASTLIATAFKNGRVYAKYNDDWWICNVMETGTSNCFSAIF